ncbi:LPD23 domain-containing protein [Microvirga sp. G4-2]|uniref:LPD23 domain-containing protein n=1 Tax=Microvirga sp. G4-2 TaxID=3434467 RepID=UPI0040448AAE
MSEFDAFAQEVAQEETNRTRQLSEATSLGAATTFEPAGQGKALPNLPAASEFDGLAEEIAKEENDKVSQGLKLAAQVDPEKYGWSKLIADRDEIPVDYVYSNLPELQKRETVSKMRGALEQNPGLREWFKQGDNAALLKVDELDRLSGLPWLFGATGGKFSEGQRQVRLGEIGAAILSGKATPDLIEEGERLNAIPSREIDTGGFLTGALPSFAEMLPSTLASLGAGFKGAATGGATGATIGGVSGAVGGAAAGGVGAIPGALAGASVGLTIGAPAGATAGAALKAYELEAGGAYWEFSQFRDETGKPLDPAAVKVASVLAGTVNAGLEMFGLETMAKQIPGVGKGVGLFGRTALKEALKRPAFRDMFTNFAKGFGETVGAEVGTEVLQEFTTMFAGELAKQASEGEFTPLTAGEWGERLLDTAKQTAQAMTVMGPLLGGSRVAKDYSEAKRAQRTVDLFTALNETVADSTLRANNPKAFKEAFEAASGDSPKAVYVPVEQLNELFQSFNVNPADLTDFTGFGDSYRDALLTGGDVEIRLSDYATKLAATPFGDALVPHIRMDPEGMTQAEAQAFNEAWAETREQLLAEDLDRLKGEQARSAPGEAVFQDVRDKAVAAGRSLDVAEQYATVWQAFFSTLAEKTGGDAFQLYQDRGVEIRFAFPEQLSYKSTDDLDLLLDDLRAGREVAIDRERRKALGPSLSTFLRSKGGLNDSGGELRSRDVGGTLLAKNGKGLNLDDAALAAWEAGYFPQFAEERPSIDDLLSAIDNELAGSPVYKDGLTPEAVDLSSEYLARLDTMGRTLDELGLPVQSLSNEAIRQELESVINQDAEQGALFQFAGIQAAVRLGTAEVPALYEATRMQAEGAYPDEIFEATGWFQGVDGAWRFEIADTDATVDTSKFTDPDPDEDGRRTYAGRLGDVLSHPNLYRAYPALADAEVTLVLGGKESGAFYPDTGEIEAQAPTEAALRSVLLHEVAHWIQGTEGFAPGGDLNMGEIYEGEAVERLQAEVRRLSQQSALKPADELLTAKQRLVQAARYEYYRRIAGEVEARNVEERDRLRQAGEFVDTPSWTQDVPDDQQIIIARTDTHGEAMRSVGAPGESAANPLVQVSTDPNTPVEVVKSGYLVESVGTWQEEIAWLKENLQGRTVTGPDGREIRISQQTRKALSSNRGSKLKAVAVRALPELLATARIYNTAPDRQGRSNLSYAYAAGAIEIDGQTYSVALRYRVDGGGNAIAYQLEGYEVRSGGSISAETAGAASKQPSPDRTLTVGDVVASFNGRVLFQKDDLGGPRADKRGSIQFSQDKSRTIINLFEKADLSTFLHESGHFFLEVTRDMALREGAPQALVDDWQAIKDWLGLKDDTVTVDAHEQFARGFEAYLFEGKAPSESLRSAFARFRAWLTFIYRKITRLNVNVTPEIRAVFDRMLATEEEINAQANAKEFRGWMDAAQAGMEEAEFQAYRKLADQATEQAKADYQAKLLADVKRETTREWNENKKAVRAEVVAEFSRMPVYQVTHYLRTGQAISEDVTVPGARLVLDRAYLVDRYGDSVLTRLPRYVPPVYADPATNKRKDVTPVHPDILAEAFGYESGDALVQDLLSAPPMARAITEEVNLRMRDRYGDLLNDQARRADEAVAAMHNDKRAEFIETEMRVLSRRGGVQNPMPRQVAARMARDIIAGKKVADATRVGLYARQEAKAARDAEAAMLAGDYKAAAEHKRRQLFAHYLAMEARRAKEEVESATRYLNRFGNRKRPAAVDPDYLDQIEGLLERFDMRPGTSLRTIAKRKALAEFIREKEVAGEAIAIPQHLRDEAATVSYKDLTVDDLRAVVDSVKNLEHLGKLKNKLLLNRKALAFQNVKDELTASAQANVDARKKIEGFNPNRWEAFNLNVLGAAAVMARMEQVIEWLDGGDINGPWRRYLWAPMAEAQRREADLREKVMAPILAVWDSFPKGYLAENHYFKSFDRNLKKSEIFALALNTGTESNLDRLLKGERLRQGGGVDTQGKLDEVLAVLTKQDWDAIQTIWDQINSLWPEASALEKRLTGLEPVKVEAREVVTPHGTYKGGYYPLVYDNAQAVDVSARLMSKEDLKMDPQFARLGREAGYLKTRVEDYSEPLSTKLDVITRHIEKVVHDITHWEAVKEVNKIVMDPEIATVIRDHLGQPFHDEFKKWLKRIWHGDDLGADFNAFQRVLGRLRTNAGIYALAYRFTTVLTQFAGFGPSAGRVGVGPLASAMKQYWLAGPSWGDKRNAVEEFAFSKSSEMKHRAGSIDRDIRLGLAKLEGKSGTLAEMQRIGFMGIAIADRWVSVPTWLAGYNKHIAEFPADEQGAIEAGDRAVRLSQGSGGTKDVSSIQVDPRMQPFTMFYGPFNILFNNLWSLGRDAKRIAREGGAPREYFDVFARAMFFVVIPAVMADLITGKGPDDEDKEERGTGLAYAQWAAAKVALYPLGTIPILRDAASFVDLGFETNPSPAGRMVNAAVKTGKELAKGSEASPRVVVKNSADTLGMLLGLPIGQATTTVNNVWRHAEEDDLQVRDFLFSRR